MAVLKNAGYIKEMLAFPCANPDPVLVIEAAGNAIAPVLMEALTFGCLDIVRMRLGKSPWHSKGIRALIEGILEPAEHDAINKIYKFIVPAEKLLFVWFVADLTVDFIANWQSQLFKLGGCGPRPHECNITAHNPGWINWPLLDWSGPIYFDVVQSPDCNFAFRDNLHVPRGWYWQFYFSISIKALFTGPPAGSVSTRIAVFSPQEFDYPANEAKPAWFGNKLTGMYKAAGHNKNHAIQHIYAQAYCPTPAVSVSGSANAYVSDRPVPEGASLPLGCLGQAPPGG